jgi:hypothetical protein
MTIDYNDTPYKGRRTDSHKQKPPKKGSGKAAFEHVVVAVVLFLALPAVAGLALAWFFAHAYGLL